MREKLSRGKRISDGEWIEGDLLHSFYSVGDVCITDGWGEYQVIPESVGDYAGLSDENGRKAFEGDIVDFCGMQGTVCFEKGAFGISVDGGIDWKTIEKLTNRLTDADGFFVYNDNFISLWEMIWNFNYSDEISCIKIIGNICDNPELLRREDAKEDKN